MTSITSSSVNHIRLSKEKGLSSPPTNKTDVLSHQSSLSVGSDLDLTETPSPAFPLRRSWDATPEGAGLEVNC